MSSFQNLNLLPGQSSSPDLTAIAAMLNEAARALSGMPATEPPQIKNSAYSTNEGETRCYYLSPSVLKHERELLQKYRVEDFNGLIAEAHTLLAGLVKVMKSTHPDTRLRGRSLSSLGSLLEQVSSLLVRMRNVYEKVERMPS